MVALYDSTHPQTIPTDAPIVAGYINGHYAWSPSDWARFPHSILLTISISATTPADILDVERYDATPPRAPTWLRMNYFNACRPARPWQRTIYCSRLSTWPTVQSAISSALSSGHLSTSQLPAYWIADHLTPPTPHLVPGSSATQYTDHATEYDLSITNTVWPNYPSNHPLPPSSQGLTMPGPYIAITPSGNGYWSCTHTGAVDAFGDAQYLGGANVTYKGAKPLAPGEYVTSFASHPTTQGYYMLTNIGGVRAYGAAAYEGGPNVATPGQFSA